MLESCFNFKCQLQYDTGAVVPGGGAVVGAVDGAVVGVVVEADGAVVEVVVVLSVEFVDDLRKMNDSMQTNPSSFQELLTASTVP